MSFTHRIGLVLSAFVFCTSHGIASELGSGCDVSCSVQSEIYEVSTRHLPSQFCAINQQNPGFEVNAWSGCQWVRSDIDTAIGMKDGVIEDKLTILYIHGNFMERNNTLNRVRIIDAHFKKRAKEDYRLILLSWPSQRDGRPLKDVNENAESAEDQSLYVAWLLNRLRVQSRVSLLAFSLGAKAATGGLHLDAGGRVPGLSSAGEILEPKGTSYRVGLIAPAIDKQWIERGGRHRHALDNVSHFVNMFNSKDPVLRRFRFIDRLTRPIAGGFAGFGGLADSRTTFVLAGGDANREPPLSVKQYDCGPAIGNTHSEVSYLGECPYFKVMIDTLLWNID